jgi:hypothetical protein
MACSSQNPMRSDTCNWHHPPAVTLPPSSERKATRSRTAGVELLCSEFLFLVKAAPPGPRRYRPARAGPASGTHATGRRLHRGPQLKENVLAGRAGLRDDRRGEPRSRP